MALRRFEGKNVEEALDHAATALGVDRQRLAHNVVVEKRSFLGGTRRVVIEAWEDDIGNRASAPPTHIPPALAQPSGERRPRGGQERGGGRGGDHGRGGRRERENRERTPRQAAPDPIVETGPTPPLPETEEAVERDLRVWFEDLFDRCGFLLDARVEQGEDRFMTRIYGRDAGKLMAHHGELMDSLQIIANKTLTVRSSGKTVELDCADFREKRIGDLERQAKELAGVVREEGREKALPPMSPVERRIVHMALRDDADVETYSRGEGFYKRVVITPRQAEASGGPTES